MSKNIFIQEGGIAKQLTVDKLKTNLVGGGTCLWVPEDETTLGTKIITENGAYKASDDGYYGYSEVTVNIPNAGTATGTDGDGDEAVAHTDPETGGLVTDKVPSSIEVITPPANPYGIYTDGQSISPDGMVVKAYLASGGEYGTVPNGEIILSPTTATYDASTDTAGEYTYDDVPEGYPNTLKTYGDFTLPPYTISMGLTYADWTNVSGKLVPIANPTGSISMFVIGDNENVHCTYTQYLNNEIRVTVESGEPTRYETDCGSVVYIAGSTFPSDGWYDPSVISKCNIFPSRYLVSIIADYFGCGEEQPAGSHQTITVSWPRPLDGKVLETTFDILVAPSPSGDGEENGNASGIPLEIP